jgi:hypothetical protein
VSEGKADGFSQARSRHRWQKKKTQGSRSKEEVENHKLTILKRESTIASLAVRHRHGGSIDCLNDYQVFVVLLELAYCI